MIRDQIDQTDINQIDIGTTKNMDETQFRNELNRLNINLIDAEIKAIKKSMTYGTPLEVILAKIKTNPYSFVLLPIERCDTIWLSLGLSSDTQNIHKQCGECLRFIYERYTKSGWMAVPHRIIMDQPIFPMIGQYWQELELILAKDYNIVIDHHRGVWYLKSAMKAETQVAQWVLTKLKTHQLELFRADDLAMRLTCEEQRDAVLTALNNSISLITGGPGTGKTTCISAIIKTLEKYDLSYVIVAPTGKAVSRVKEHAGGGNKVYTIHRLLYCLDPPPFQVLIVDESSMVTISLMSRFIRRFTHHYSVIFLGDQNQLPPIGAGALLKELIRSQLIPRVNLVENHRSKDSDGIKNVLNQFNEAFNGKIITVKSFNNEKVTLNDIKPNQIYDKYANLIQAYKEFGVKSDDIMVISPINKPIEQFNDIFHRIYLTNQPMALYNGIKWSIGDRVMMTKNNAEADVYNGDEFIIIGLKNGIQVMNKSGREYHFDLSSWDSRHKKPQAQSKKSKAPEIPGSQEQEKIRYCQLAPNKITKRITFKDDSGDVPLDEDNNADTDNALTVDKLRPAWAISVHKAQGSEAQHVIIFVPPYSNSFTNQNLYYTAFSRASKTICVMGSSEHLEIGINTKAPFRWEYLADRINPNLQCNQSTSIIQKNINSQLPAITRES